MNVTVTTIYGEQHLKPFGVLLCFVFIYLGGKAIFLGTCLVIDLLLSDRVRLMGSGI